METDEKYRLCGGTFFVLLTRGKRRRPNRRNRLEGEKDGVSDTDFMTELIKVFSPTYEILDGASFKTVTNKYKTCQEVKSSHLPFYDSILIEQFSNEVANEYVKPLLCMANFLDTFIAQSYKSWLVNAFLELMEADDNIPDDALFFIKIDGSAVSKKSIIQSDHFDFQPFILGVWHYVLTHVTDNSIGAATYDAWHKAPEVKGGRYEFISEIGKNITRTISIDEINPRRLYSTPIFMPADIAPEITENAPLILVPNELLTPSGEYDEYLDNTFNKFSKLRTLLYNEEPHDFYEFYVCNAVAQKNSGRFTPRKDEDFSVLRLPTRYIMITGTGGLGKSMMMRHLLLDAIANYQDLKLLPIFVPLKDYDEKHKSFLEYVYERFEHLGGDKTIDEFERILKYGKCLLLLDGLDEVNSNILPKFEKDIDIFIDKYSRNRFVVSSRPASDYLSFSRFTIFNLQPLYLEQALQLIDNLKFRPDEPKIKEKFRKALKEKLFTTHREFAQNPLLLTIMLMTYEQFAEVPSKMHIFYHEVYVALSQKHDANKGSYKRTLETGLSADSFAEYFAEFCAQSYHKEMYEMTDEEFARLFENLNLVKKENHVDATAFRNDLVNSMCLMYSESGKYHFTHRSFQEYFCALYFSKQKDKNLPGIGDFFENKRINSYNDKTFSMLYDMIPEKIEEYIFLSLLTKSFENCDSNKGYETFVSEMYPSIIADQGETPEIFFNRPVSFLYEFVTRINHCAGDLDILIFPFDEDFVTREAAYIKENWENEDAEGYDSNADDDILIFKDEIDASYYLTHDEPDSVGYLFEIDVEKIFSEPELHDEMYNFITADTFPLVEEYNEVRKYYEYLKNKAAASGPDLFDSFL